MDHRSAEVKAFSRVHLSPDSYSKHLSPFLNKVALFEEHSVSLAMTACQTALKDITQPNQFFLAVSLVQQAVEVNNRLILKYLKNCLLKYFIEIAQFQKESSDENRGQYLFGKNVSKEEKQMGIDTLRLVLECLRVWAQYYPKDDLLVPAYRKLVAMKVTFPKKYLFFVSSKVSVRHPISSISPSKDKINIPSQQNTPSIELLSEEDEPLEQDYESQVMSDDDLVYQQIFKEVLSSRHSYSALSQQYIGKLLTQGDDKHRVIQDILLALKESLLNYQLRPMKSILALRFMRDALEYNELPDHFCVAIERELLPLLSQICFYYHHSAPDQLITRSLNTFCLEMVLTWSLRYQGQFKSLLKDLLMKDIDIIPLLDRFSYFDISQIDFAKEFISVRNSLSSLHLVLVTQINNRQQHQDEQQFIHNFRLNIGEIIRIQRLFYFLQDVCPNKQGAQQKEISSRLQELLFIKEQYERYYKNGQDILDLQQSISRNNSPLLFFQNYQYLQSNHQKKQMKALQSRFIIEYMADKQQHGLLLTKIKAKDMLYIEILLDSIKTLLKHCDSQEKIGLLVYGIGLIKQAFQEQIEECIAKTHVHLLKPMMKLLLQLHHQQNNELAELLQECFMVWNCLFSVKFNGFYYALFQIAYSLLCDHGVVFPSTLRHFDIDLTLRFQQASSQHHQEGIDAIHDFKTFLKHSTFNSQANLATIMNSLLLKETEIKQFIRLVPSLGSSQKQALEQQLDELACIGRAYSLFRERKLEYVQLKRQFSDQAGFYFNQGYTIRNKEGKSYQSIRILNKAGLEIEEPEIDSEKLQESISRLNFSHASNKDISLMSIRQFQNNSKIFKQNKIVEQYQQSFLQSQQQLEQFYQHHHLSIYNPHINHKAIHSMLHYVQSTPPGHHTKSALLQYKDQLFPQLVIDSDDEQNSIMALEPDQQSMQYIENDAFEAQFLVPAQLSPEPSLMPTLSKTQSHTHPIPRLHLHNKMSC